jgi:hypothetical protein
MLIQVISGGQTGADQGALIAARDCGLCTGGWMPRGFRTADGPRPDLAADFGLQENSSPHYAPRTRRNVQEADATLRLARKWNTSGERATLKFLRRYGKPYLNVSIDSPLPPADVAEWLRAHRVRVLNVAGNREQNAPGIESFVAAYLRDVFRLVLRART